MLKSTLGETIEVETVVGGGLWNTMADPAQVESAILNLALNARDAMDRGGKLIVKTVNLRAGSPEAGMTGEHIGIFVSDTGRGIDPSFLPADLQQVK